MYGMRHGEMGEVDVATRTGDVEPGVGYEAGADEPVVHDADGPAVAGAK